MNNFDLSKAKFLSVLIGICLIFIIVIWHAFDYLPKETPEIQNLNEEITETTNDDTSLSNDNEEISNDTTGEQEYIEEQTPVDINQNKRAKLEPLETIYEEESNSQEKINVPEQNQGNNIESILKRAKDLSLNQDYESAITEYKSILSSSTDENIKATCYENLALIYAVQKRYGTALTNANKAYNIEPTVAREVMLARLYFRTGSVDSANNRINNVLRREFTIK